MDQDTVTAIILAGGMGTRISHLHPDLPKPMIPVAGKPFIHWICQLILKSGIQRVIISCGYKGDAIQNYFSNIIIPGLEIICVHEKISMGTGGAVRYAVENSGVESKFWMLMNGDSLVAENLSSFMCKSVEIESKMNILSVHVADASRYGSITTTKEGYLKNFNEKVPGSGNINSGIYMISNSLIQRMTSNVSFSFERDFIPKLIAEGHLINISLIERPFLDIGTPESLLEADSFIKNINFYKI